MVTYLTDMIIIVKAFIVFEQILSSQPIPRKRIDLHKEKPVRFDLQLRKV